MACELILDCCGCGDDVVVVHGRVDVGCEELPEGFRVLLGLGCVSCVGGVVDERLLHAGDDLVDCGHCWCWCWFVKCF